jgi:hypothetical protein
MVCSAEVLEHVKHGEHYMPSKMLIKWHKENVSMVWQMNNPQINVQPSQKFWDMPQMRDSINMGLLAPDT